MNKLAEFLLKYEKNVRQAVEDKLSDPGTVKVGGGGRAFISNPTEQKAIRHIMGVGTVCVPYGPKIAGKCGVKTIRNPEKWLRCIAETWKYYKGRRAGDVMVEHYKNGRDIVETAAVLKISPQRVYYYIDDVHKYLISSGKGCGAYQRKLLHPERVEAIMDILKKKKEN